VSCQNHPAVTKTVPPPCPVPNRQIVPVARSLPFRETIPEIGLRLMLRSSFLLAFIAATGCASMQTAAGLNPESLSSVTVFVGARGSEGLTRIQEAAARAGWPVSATSPGLVTVSPVSIREDPNVRMTLHAALVGDSAIVRGTVTDPLRGLRDYPIRASQSGRAAWGWRELTRFAADIGRSR
jgi:hypothetical protein